MCIIIGDVHQLIGHCLIPLDLWFYLLNLEQSTSIDENIDYKCLYDRKDPAGAAGVLDQTKPKQNKNEKLILQLNKDGK